MSCGIYCITNKINNHKYIGKSKNIESRGNNHKNSNRGTNNKLYLAIKKYGIENFIFDIIEECPVSKLNEKEIYGIKYFHTYYKDPDFNGGYNLTKGGDGRDSEELKEGGQNHPKYKEQGIEHIRQAHLGRPLSEQTKIKIGKAQKEYRKKYPYTLKEKRKIAEHSGGIHVKVYNQENIFIEEFPSIKGALTKFLKLKNHSGNSARALRKAAKNHTLYHGYYGEVIE